LRTLHTAQQVFTAACAVDLDGDGVGEIGTLGELTGFDALRGRAANGRFDPPILPPSIRPTGSHGTAARAGYLFRLYLPGRDGAWLRVDEDAGRLDVDAAETRWCAFAWPAHHDAETTRTFRIDETGRVTATAARVDASRLGRVDTTAWVEVR
jgi:hypothetical protein